MFTKTSTHILAGAALLAGIGMAAADQGKPASLVTMDEDRDDEITREEFEAIPQEQFGLFDSDESGEISEDEFAEGMFDFADTDESGTLDPDEMEAFDTVRGVGEEVD